MLRRIGVLIGVILGTLLFMGGVVWAQEFLPVFQAPMQVTVLEPIKIYPGRCNVEVPVSDEMTGIEIENSEGFVKIWLETYPGVSARADWCVQNQANTVYGMRYHVVVGLESNATGGLPPAIVIFVDSDGEGPQEAIRYKEGTVVNILSNGYHEVMVGVSFSHNSPPQTLALTLVGERGEPSVSVGPEPIPLQ